MGRRGEDLAQRFRQALERRDALRRHEEEQRARHLEAQRQERTALFEDLAAFGQAIGHLAVEHGEQGVTFRLGDRFLAFEPQGEGEAVRVTFTDVGDEAHRLYRQPELGLRWVWARRHRAGEDRLPLFDQGLENLMIHALKVPAPSDVLAGDPGSTLEDVVPKSLEDRKRDL